MWRTILLAAAVYVCGYPALDGYRPQTLDAPLQAFYRQINRAGQEGRAALETANIARANYFRAYMARAEKQLKSGDWKPSLDPDKSSQP
jgi:hypothetical protein